MRRWYDVSIKVFPLSIIMSAVVATWYSAVTRDFNYVAVAIFTGIPGFSWYALEVEQDKHRRD